MGILGGYLGGFQVNAQSPSTTPSLEAFLGGEGKAVWVQALSEEGDRDPFMIAPAFRLLGQSTSDSAPIELLAGPVAYRRPLMIPDGSGVIVSEMTSETHLHVEWDKPGNPSNTVPGIAMEVWQEPEGGTIWVYVGGGAKKGPQTSFSAVQRYQLGKPDTLEPVWDRRVSLDNFQLSADGAQFGAVFPWPHAGVGSLKGENSWEKYLHGCWPSIAPDNSGLAWVFDGAHRNLQMFHRNPDLRWNVEIGNKEELQGHEMYHPRWANHPRFISVTGPFRRPEGTHGTVIGEGGAGVEIYLGRFSESLGEMEDMFRLTENDRADFAPDLWIKGGESESLQKDLLIAGKPEGSPISHSAPENWPLPGAVFGWQSARTTNEIEREEGTPPLSCQLSLHDGALLGSSYELALGAGTAKASSEVAAHVIDQIASSGQFTVEFTGTALDFSDRPDAVLLEIGDEDRGPLLQIAQRIGWVTYALRTSATQGEPAFSQGSVPIWFEHDVPTHLSVRFDGREVSILPDGQNWCQQLTEGDLSLWKDCKKPYLILGGKKDGSARWKGGLENVAIYPRFLPDAEVIAQAATVLEETYDREKPPRYEVHGKLIRMAPSPSVEDLGAYSRSFVSYEYELTRVDTGDLKPQRVEVRHYAILDRRPVEGLPRQIGKSYVMSLEPWESHPQAASDRISELDGELSLLPVFIDVRHHQPISEKAFAASLLPKEVPGDLGSALRESVGGEAKVIWVKDPRPAGPEATSQFRELWKFDSATDKEPIRLLEQVRSFSEPEFSKDGTEVWFFDATVDRSYAVHWTTGQLRELGKGRKIPDSAAEMDELVFSDDTGDIFIRGRAPIRVTLDQVIDTEADFWMHHDSRN